MAKLSRAGLEALYNNIAGSFPNQTTQNITPTVQRQCAKDFIDSLGNLTDDGQMLMKIVTLSSADILALFTTPKEIIAAPGAAYFIEVISFSLKNIFNSVAYAGAGALDIWLNYGATTTALHNTSLLVNGVVSSYQKLNLDSQAERAATLRQNKSITLSSHSSNPTTGNGTAKAFIVYQILPF